MSGQRSPRLPAGTLGVVVIGRNEGDRLVACLTSLAGSAAVVVYVDSGSSDGSVENARRSGACVVELDMSVPFTAARARNAGYRALKAEVPDVEFVQFVDGDCIVVDGWIAQARRFLVDRPDVAVAAGRRRERFPERSIYNAICDREWDTPVGEAQECGGDALVRAAAFEAVGGYSDDLIAGEEPEMCVRLRAAGWKIWRLDAEMTLHDANITRFGQWWRRSRRAGHAFAEVSARHAASPFGIWKRNTLRALVWGLALPAAAVLGAVLVHPAALLLLAAYPLQVARLARRSRAGKGSRWLDAFYAVLGKFPEAQGVLQYHAGRLRGRRNALIEYK